MDRLKSIIADDLFMRNREAAQSRNKKILRIVLIATICCYIMLFVMSFVSKAYLNMRYVYLTIILLFTGLILLTHFISDRGCTLLTYVLHFGMVAFCTYNSAFVWPDDICVMLTAELFIFSTLILDKNWRIIAITVFSGMAHVFVISFFKVPYHFVDEMINTACFTVLSAIVGVFTRTTQLKNFDIIEKLRISEEHYKLAMKHSSGIICEYNVAERCVIMSEDVATVFGTPQKVCNVPYGPVESGAISPDSADAYIGFYEGIIMGKETGEAEFASMTVNGWRWQKAVYSTIFDADLKPVSAVISFSDITEQREKAQLQKKQAETDGLTGVYNRATAQALISEKLSLGSEPFALLIADVDNLKKINDTFGHPEGDAAIKALSDALRQRVGDGGIVGRIGGDEFIAFLGNVKGREWFAAEMEAVMDTLSKVCVGEKHDYHLSASMGIVIAKGSMSFEELYSMADKALYKAKQSGKNQFAFYTKL